jgi:hypothetical protein
MPRDRFDSASLQHRLSRAGRCTYLWVRGDRWAPEHQLRDLCAAAEREGVPPAVQNHPIRSAASANATSVASVSASSVPSRAREFSTGAGTGSGSTQDSGTHGSGATISAYAPRLSRAATAAEAAPALAHFGLGARSGRCLPRNVCVLEHGYTHAHADTKHQGAGVMAGKQRHTEDKAVSARAASGRRVSHAFCVEPHSCALVADLCGAIVDRAVAADARRALDGGSGSGIGALRGGGDNGDRTVDEFSAGTSIGGIWIAKEDAAEEHATPFSHADDARTKSD